MNRSALKGASATMALLVGLGLGDPAWAAGRDTGQAVQRVRQHVQNLKAHRPKAAILKVKAAKSAPRPGVVLASYTAEELAANVEEEPEEELVEDVVVELPLEVEPGDEPAPVAAAQEPEPATPAPAVAEVPAPRPEAVAVQPPPEQAPAPQPVQPPPQTARAESRQQVSAAAEVPPQQELPGVLTKRGTLVVEPSIEYSHSDVNQFTFGGVSIAETVLIGGIEATQANRDAVTATLGLRYGITNRFEGELRIPYMYRSDTTTNTFVDATNSAQRTSSDGNGLGDLEAAAHYQLNDGTGKWPVMVANFRAKSKTGTSPYDVDRSPSGIEDELATGSGFWGFEPSLTFIAPSDPAVFFANIGYLWNVKGDVDKQIGNRFIRSVDPGDAVRLGIGMGIALNEKVSFSIGYQHDFIMSTNTKFADGEADSDSLQVGSLTFGVNYQVADNASVNVSVGVGVTNDSPDVRLMARVPIAISLF